MQLIQPADNQDEVVEYRDIPILSEYGKIGDGYQVGSDGSFWSAFSANGQRIGSDGRRYKRLRGSSHSRGYVVVMICGGAMKVQFLLHRLVLLTFVGPCPDGMEACHNNGDPSDNRLENLRYDTHAANIADKELHGTMLRGEDIGNAKLTGLDVDRIRRLVDFGVPQNIVAKVFSVSKAEVCRISAGLRWKA